MIGHDVAMSADQSPPAGPRASVIVPTHHGAGRLPDLLDALVGQDEGDFEVIVVVDGADSVVLDVLASYRDRLTLTTLVNEANEGVGAALARGYASANSPILIRCDDDITPPPTFISGHLAWHEEGTDRGIVSATRDRFEDSAYARGYGRWATDEGLRQTYALAPDQRWSAWAACNSTRRDSYERVGGFDSDLTYSEDLDLGYRLWRGGVEIIVDPALEVVHRGPLTTAAQRVRRAYVSGVARREFWRRHPAAAGSARRDASAPRAPRERVWAALVAMVAMLVRSPRSATRLGEVADCALARGPHRIARRVVALAVQASGRAGRRDSAVASWERAREAGLQPTHR